jgi:hypothetical protein
VRIHQVVAAKLACIGVFCAAVCGALTCGVGIELLVLGLATPADVVGLVVLLLATLAHGTASSLWVALVAKDFRTVNNLAGVAIVPGIFAVLLGTARVKYSLKPRAEAAIGAENPTMNETQPLRKPNIG